MSSFVNVVPEELASASEQLSWDRVGDQVRDLGGGALDDVGGGRGPG